MFCVLFLYLDTLSYTFDHIWTNLLTQCTSVPVPVFCCFLFHVFRLLKVLQKFQKNQIKNQRIGTFWNNLGGARGPPPGTQAPWWRALGAGHARGRLAPWWTPWMPPFPYILPPRRKSLKSNSFARSPLCTAAAAVSRSGLPGDTDPAPCRKKESPP